MAPFRTPLITLLSFGILGTPLIAGPDQEAPPKALIDGTGPGWKPLGEADFVNVNCKPDTWTWKEGHAFCTGQPVGVIRSKAPIKNFELVCEWMHKKDAGNSGVFLWASEDSIKKLEAGNGLLPDGIEVQVLDLGYAAQYEKQTKKPADWFTSHGDVFPTGPAKMTPFPPVAPNGKRSFPSKNLTKGINRWNHYYIRAINGEVRLWVNGEEVSGGTNCDPANGYLCLESEGSPIEFKNIRLRILP
ncbi:MAG: 3-keto-disaccharide hydrolase [Verrucomicrobiaceae bacterium]